MTISPSGPIQEALYERMSTDPVLAEMQAGVFDYVDEEEERPRRYIVIGESLTTPDNTHGSRGWKTVSTLSIWTEERGFKVANEIKDRILEIFDHQPLTVNGFHHVETRHEFDQMLRDPKPTLRRALLRLRTTTEQGI